MKIVVYGVVICFRGNLNIVGDFEDKCLYMIHTKGVVI